MVPYLNLDPIDCSGSSDVVYLCPDYRGDKYLCIRRFGAFSGSYGMNFGGTDNESGLRGDSRDAPVGQKYFGLRESAIRAPSDMITILDSHLFRGAQGDLKGLEWTSHRLGRFNLEDPVAKKAMLRRHRGRFNVLFADGHLESIAMDKLYEESTEARRRWNREHKP